MGTAKATKKAESGGIGLSAKFPSVGEVLDRRKGFGPGFDFLRLALALLVALFHTELIMTGGKLTFEPASWLISFSVLPMFFALGGFLVTGSAERLPLRDFMLNRASRIYPGLIVETILSAVILGPIVTTLSLSIYFADPDFLEYFLSLTGWIQFDLPGVFLTNPVRETVNASLWSVPQDLAGYALLAILIATGMFKRPSVMLGTALAMLALDAAMQFFEAASGPENGVVFFGARLMAGFFFGCAMYKYRYQLPCHGGIAIGLVTLILIVSYIGHPSWKFSIPVRELSIPAFAYLIVFLGTVRMPRIPILMRGDFSYGIYLYVFPVQQSLTYFLPEIRSVPLHFAISILAVIPLAAFSWYAIERPILRIRRRHSFVANQVDAAASLKSVP